MAIIRIESSDITAAYGGLDSLGRSGRLALGRAVKKVTAFAYREAISRVSTAAGIPRRALTHHGRSKRIHASQSKSSSQFSPTGLVWIGYNPISVSKLGKIKQAGDGTRVGKRIFPGSFIATMPSGFISSFHRAKNARIRPSTNMWGITSLPIEEDKVNIDGAVNAAKQIEFIARIRLKQLVAQELNYELNVKGLRR